jgi:PAT family beta-lactamase induction signal transducer AmpG
VSDPKVLADAQNGQTGWRRAVLVYKQPRMLSMLLLGFSAGLPFYLVFQSLSAWLRQEGIVRSTIGMFAWVGLAYSFKFIWSPIVDRMPLPVLTRLFGKRRSWMLFAQAGIAIGLLNLSLSNPAVTILPIALWALFVAFCAATQDIAVDAWRIETAGTDGQAGMASAYQIGYRIALIMGSAGTFALADSFGWKATYTIMAAMVSVGVVTTLMSKEPQSSVPRDSLEREERVISWLAQRSHWSQPMRTAGSWFIGAVVCPLLDFFGRYGGALAVLILLFMCTYRLTDFTMGSMTNSFYIDKGYTLTQIATVVKFYGLMMSIIGVIVAGIVITKFGTLRSLILGSIMVMISNLGFSSLAAIEGTSLLGLGLVNGFDNLALAMHGTALITFLSSLTSPRYTATQYALFSSLYALPAKILEGFSGFVVDAIGYQMFFVYTASLSIPALILLYWIAKHGIIKPPVTAAAPA